MKICYVVPAIVNKAPILVALQLCEQMLRRGHDVTVLYFDERVDIGFLEGVRFERVSFYKKFDFSGYDIVHSHLLRADAFVFKNKSFFSSVRYVSTLHNYVEKELYFHYNKLVSVVFSFVWNVCWTRHDRLVVLSDHSMQYYSKFSYNKKLSRVYNGRDIVVNYELIEDWCAAEISNLKSKVDFLLGTYCVLTATKGVDQLVRLLALNTRLGLVVIGDGPEKNILQDLSVSLGVDSRCVFISSIPYAHQCNVFFDIFAMPSRSEGFGLALIEAALHSKKIVCSDIPIFRELFDEDAVSFFKLDDIVGLNAAVVQSLAEESKGSVVLSVACEKYSSFTMASNYLEVYEELTRD
ncbi:glycosyltransferase family 4 protein [Pseudomonas sp. CCUG 57209]|uniref:glycosyltransferase family 4 protein n=1 Tax=Pseudomonas sivasensis TaxID=1880678 RepID=UPI0015EB3DFA|nr:glycosyltransferase family 4 protein [Pseudomonas sivasensis]MBA2929179.1 glycosyltransferase family 4 protein [Pseudomonas sivasensis]